MYAMQFNCGRNIQFDCIEQRNRPMYEFAQQYKPHWCKNVTYF